MAACLRVRGDRTTPAAPCQLGSQPLTQHTAGCRPKALPAGSCSTSTSPETGQAQAHAGAEEASSSNGRQLQQRNCPLLQTPPAGLHVAQLDHLPAAAAAAVVAAAALGGACWRPMPPGILAAAAAAALCQAVEGCKS